MRHITCCPCSYNWPVREESSNCSRSSEELLLFSFALHTYEWPHKVARNGHGFKLLFDYRAKHEWIFYHRGVIVVLFLFVSSLLSLKNSQIAWMTCWVILQLCMCTRLILEYYIFLVVWLSGCSRFLFLFGSLWLVKHYVILCYKYVILLR